MQTFAVFADDSLQHPMQHIGHPLVEFTDVISLHCSLQSTRHTDESVTRRPHTMQDATRTARSNFVDCKV